jgi:transcriptional regulator with GAF, ATPase, and Fis domain
MNPVTNEPKEISHFFPKGIPKQKKSKTFKAIENRIALPQISRKEVFAPTNDFVNSPFSWFWGAGSLMRSVWEELQIAARHDIHTLLVGETGCGKEVVAREIHRLRCERLRKNSEETPFVAINCAAIPEGLAESMLFGHERGAFTSAREKQSGRFEQAQGGTLFLDEIQNLSFAVQAKLLRVLQTGEIERLGAHKSIKTECKIIAASNIPLDMLVEKGMFRKDLYFRLSIAPILIPPLRARLGDLPVLAKKLCAELCKRHDFISKEIDSEYLKKLQDHPWSGNLRELEHALLYSLLKTDNKKNRLELCDLPSNINGLADAFNQDGNWDTSHYNDRKVAKDTLQAT